MAQTRERLCIYYEYEGKCLKGKDGTFRQACQNCHKYKAKPGGPPARLNLKKKKINKIYEQDTKEMIKNHFQP